MPAGSADHCFLAALRTTSLDTRQLSLAVWNSLDLMLDAPVALEYAPAAFARAPFAFWSNDSAAVGCSIASADAATLSTRPK